VYKLLDELLLMLPVTAASTAIVFSACRLQGSFLLFWLVNLVTLANGTCTHLQLLCFEVQLHGPCISSVLSAA
jgi:hypothetical protein